MSTYKYEINELNIELDVPSGVLCPSVFSLTLAKSLKNCDYRTAIDVGCGSGILGTVLAKLGIDRVYSVDTNLECIETTQKNAVVNGVESQIIARQGNLFEPFANKHFDLIVCNPPTLPTNSSLPKYYDGGQDGHQFIDALIKQSYKHLNKTGKLELILSSLADIDRTETIAHSSGLYVEKQSCGYIEFRPFYFQLLRRFVEESRKTGSYYLKKDGSFFEELFILRATIEQ